MAFNVSVLLGSRAVVAKLTSTNAHPNLVITAERATIYPKAIVVNAPEGIRELIAKKNEAIVGMILVRKGRCVKTSRD